MSLRQATSCFNAYRRHTVLPPTRQHMLVSFHPHGRMFAAPSAPTLRFSGSVSTSYASLTSLNFSVASACFSPGFLSCATVNG